MAKKAEGKMIKLTLVRSPIGYPEPQKSDRACPGFSPFTSNRGTRGHTGIAWNACQSYSHDSH